MTSTFSKILIANRGEIACRIMRSAKTMGIKTVAVCSEADIYANHTLMADEFVCIGPPAANESYLLPDAILAACKKTGAEAVHPGYGFLSERADFVRAVTNAGLAFIGPTAEAVDAMGDKIASRKLAEEAGVPIIPGHTGVVETEDDAQAIAEKIGYPVMIKASAGGGGKGMRVAYTPAELKEGFVRAKSEASSSFGDDRVFIEKFVVSPRHIEIQVLADTHGNTVWLGERECSIQRRNQKVIEEAPAPTLSDATRQKMGACAAALAQSVGYVSAGTVEFVVDQDENFYFLEMNTRLQVEHPITELTTGIDLVEQMIRIAAGEPLSFTQDDITRRGHAIEARVCAEDPERNFMPAIGRLLKHEQPSLQEGRTVRIDTGVSEGSEVSMFYDSMIAKLCVHAETRAEAIAGLQTALDDYVIRGVGHNIPFLSAILAEPRFQSGETTTGFIAEIWPDGFTCTLPPEPLLTRWLIATAAVTHQISSRQRETGNDRSREARAASSYDLAFSDQTVRVKLDCEERVLNGTAHVNGTSIDYQGHWQEGAAKAEFHFGDGTSVRLQLTRQSLGFIVESSGYRLAVTALSPRRAELLALLPKITTTDDSAALICPMPGLVIALNVKEGETVEEGDIIAIVEAMKMENSLRAPRSGQIARLPVQVGDSLSAGDLIAEFESS